MKKILLVCALVIGGLIPIFAGRKEFYYIAAVAFGILVFFFLKKKSLRLTDLLILLMATIPLHTFRFGSESEFIRLSEIVFAPLFLWWLLTRLHNKTRGPLVIRKEFLFLIAYLVVNILSTSNSVFPMISAKRILILAYLLLFTYMVSDIVDKKEKLDAVITAGAAIAALSAIVAVIQCAFPQWLVFYPVPIGRIFGFTLYRAGAGWHDPNYYALYMGMNAAFTLSFLLFSNKNKNFLSLCFCLQIAGLAATFSRTIFLSFIIVTLYLLFVSRRKTLALSGTLVLLIVLGILGTSMNKVYNKLPFVASVVFRIPEAKTIEKEPTLIAGHRFAAFQANWAMFTDHPLLGVGPFMAQYNFEKYHPSKFKYPTSTLATHNQYLQLLSEKGIFGFIFFLGFIGAIIRQINISLKRFKNSSYQPSLMAFKAAIFVYLIASLALETSYELQFWLTIGLSMAVFALLKNESPDA